MAKSKTETPAEVSRSDTLGASPTNGPPAETAVSRYVPSAPATTWSAIRNLAEAIQVAEMMARSNAMPDLKANAGLALLKILAGAEMGFGPFASLMDVHIIEGKPSVGAHLKAAAIKRSDKYDMEPVQHDETVCELAFYERSLPSGGETRKMLPGWVRKPTTIRLTMEEAHRRGLTRGKSGIKSNWAQHGKAMLYARCVTEGFKVHCPDLTGGVLAYDPDELEPGPDQAITVEVVERPAPVQQEPEPEVEPPAPISQEQFDAIVALAKDVGFSDDDLADRVMGMFGHRSLSGLAAEEAGRLLKKLKATKAAREKAKQAEPAGAPS